MYIISDANESLQHGLDVVRANPIPVALIGLGVAWLISNNTGMTDRVAGTASNVSRRVTNTASDMSRRVTDTASDMSRRASELATGAAQKVGLASSDDRALGHTGHPMVDRD